MPFLEIITPYFHLFSFVYFMNLIPAFMPPTWTVVSFFLIKYKLVLAGVVFISAFAAMLGRITLAWMAGKFIRPLLPEKVRQNYESLGKVVDGNKSLTVPLILLYAFLPIPSNQMFIAAGLAKVNVKFYAICFFAGRLISYTFWSGATRHMVQGWLQVSIGSKSLNIFIGEAVGLLSIVLLGLIDWKKHLKRFYSSKK